MGKRGQHIASERQRRLQGRRVVGLSRRQQNDADAAEATAMAADALAFVRQERAARDAEDAAPCEDCNAPPGVAHRKGCIWDNDQGEGGEGGEGGNGDSEQSAAADSSETSAAGDTEP